MARVSKGNTLSGLILQSGWTIEDDGFGLLTASAVYRTRHGTTTGKPGTGQEALTISPKRGDAFPQDKRMHCHRASSVMDANGIQTISVEYVGIANGSITNPQVSGRFNSNQEPIATHPSFGTFGGTRQSPLNGATFENDGSFKRFSDPSYAEFYGVTSYLVPGFGVTGHFYTSDAGALNKLKKAVGTTSATGYWQGFDLMGSMNKNDAPTWKGVNIWQADNENDQLLLTGVACEYFGKLLKVSYDISYSQDGWNKFIYGSRNTSKPSSQSGSSWKGKGSYYSGWTSGVANRTSAWTP